MSEITAEQIRKAKSFALSDNKYFDEDTKVGKTYKLYRNHDGSVFHFDESGFDWEHVTSDGRLDVSIERALAAGHITYHFTHEKTPKYFRIAEIEINFENDERIVSIITDSTGVNRLNEIESEVNQQAVLAELKRQRDEIQRKIDELEQAK